MNEDPLMDLSEHLNNVHDTEERAAWKRYARRFWAFALTAVATWASFILIFVDVRFLAGLVGFGFVTTVLMRRMNAARKVWVVLFQWGDDAE